jgi:hypothetical protein
MALREYFSEGALFLSVGVRAPQVTTAVASQTAAVVQHGAAAAFTASPQAAAALATPNMPDATLVATSLAAFTAAVTAPQLGLAAATPAVAASVATVATTAGVLALPVIGFTGWKAFNQSTCSFGNVRAMARAPTPSMQLAEPKLTYTVGEQVEKKDEVQEYLQQINPLRIDLALNTTPWMQRNIMDKLLKQSQDMAGSNLARLVRTPRRAGNLVMMSEEIEYEMFDPIRVGVQLAPFLALLAFLPKEASAAMTTVDSISSTVAASADDFGGYTIPIIGLGVLAATIALLAGPVED